MKATIQGPYDMVHQSGYFGGWTRTVERSVVMAFPVEGWTRSAAVTLRQIGEHTVSGEVVGADSHTVNAAWRQALAVLSLDIDGSGYPDVGDRDPVFGALQREHHFLRPVLFHSPYEAACAFVTGHRIRVEQGRAIRAHMARDHGESFEIGGTTVSAFSSPQVLREITSFPGVSDEKIDRLHGVADAALGGLLGRAALRARPVDDALAEVRKLRGIGAFFATAIVMRGAGLVDAVPDDEVTRAGIERFYGHTDVERVTQAWKPYRTWCSVLIHASEREARG